jgi:ribosomal protein L7Ae-like RNA K-turn-binding protein
VVRGTGPVREALRAGEASLVLLARDASPTQTKKITGILAHREIPSIVYGTKAELGQALGSGPVTAVALTQSALAASFLKKFEASTGSGSSPTTEEEEDQRYAG